MSDFVHIIQSDFASGAIRRPDIDNFFEKRISYFERYTLQSLIKQTSSDFYISVPLTRFFPRELITLLDNTIRKYTDKFFYGYIDIDRSYYDNFLKTCRPAQFVYATRIDTDDLYRNDVIEEIQSYSFVYRGALLYQKGYILDTRTMALADWFRDSPPFYTIMYPYNIFCDRISSINYLNSPNGHTDILRSMNTRILSENKFIVTTHGMNSTTSFENNNENQYKKDEINNIIKNFGL